MGGKIVSVTTDGFITNLKNLEDNILTSTDSSKLSLLREYRKMREILSGDPSALELKHEYKGPSSIGAEEEEDSYLFS
jgi:hypothetical protein